MNQHFFLGFLQQRMWGISSAPLPRQSLGIFLIPSGKRLHNYGKSTFLMGKSTINGPFCIAMLVYQRVTSISDHISAGCKTSMSKMATTSTSISEKNILIG